MEYLEIPSGKRRRSNAKGTNKGIQLLNDTPLQTYSSGILSLSQRSRLVKIIIGDLTSDDCAWDENDRSPALKVIKELSRLPGSSETLASKEILRQLVTLTRSESYLPPSSGERNDVSVDLEKLSLHASRQNLENIDLLLRTLNNILLQHESSRIDFGSKSVGGMQMALDLIEKHPAAIITFLSARLVFFSTLFEAVVTKDAVEQLHLVQKFAKRTDTLVQGKVEQEEDMALSELQKAFFNVGLYYPRLAKNDHEGKAIVGEKFHEALLPFLAPTINLVVSHPSRSPASLAPPITNAIAVLLNYPVAPYRQYWTCSSRGGVNGKSSRQSPSKNGSSSSDELSQNSWSSPSSRAKKMANSLFGRNNASSSSSSARRLLTKSSTSSLASSDHSFTFVHTLLDLIDEFLSHYFQTLDPDDGSAAKLAKESAVDLQDYAEPALLLLRRLVDEVVDFRRVIKQRLLPADIDRSIGLNMRLDVTGNLIRLMSSADYTRLARASGEVLLALCDGESAKMTSEIGYGPCAGFLNSIGKMHSLPGASTSTTANGNGRAIDPITGKVLPSEEEMAKQDEEAGLTAMTEEEKEAEAERLFSLFDRMDRTGIIKTQNPVRQGVESGRIREIEAKEEKESEEKAKREQDELETTVEREMKAFREKQKRQLKK